MNALFDLLTKSELALELDATYLELDRKQATIDAQAEEYAALRTTAQALLDRLDNLTTAQFSVGGEAKEREALRDLLNKESE